MRRRCEGNLDGVNRQDLEGIEMSKMCGLG